MQTKRLIKNALKNGKHRPRHIQRWVLEQDGSGDASKGRLRLRQAMEIDRVQRQLDAMVKLGEAVRTERTIGTSDVIVAEYRLIDKRTAS